MKNGKKDIAVLLSEHKMPLLLLVLLFVFTVGAPSFVTPLNLSNIVIQNTHVIIVVLGLAFVMIGGGVDLSIGYQISLISAIIGEACQMGISIPLVWILAIGVGMLCGALNGWLIAYKNQAPYAATLVTQMLFHGLSVAIYYGRGIFTIPESFRFVVLNGILGIQIDIWLTLFSVIVVGIIFSRTFYGKVLRAMGENKDICRIVDIDERFARWMAYVISGVFYAVATIVLVSRQAIASSTNGVGMEITAIIIIFISGIASWNVSGYCHVGSAKIINAVIAALCIGFISNGLLLIDVEHFYEYFAIFAIALLVMLGKTGHQQRKRKRPADVVLEDRRTGGRGWND